MLERHFNWLNDCRWNWAPLFYLRPDKCEFIGLHVILMFGLLCFGPISICGGLFAFWFLNGQLGLWVYASVNVSVVAAVLSFCTAITHQYVAFHFWNRRAERIRRSPDFVPPIASGFARVSSEETTNDPFRPPQQPNHTLDTSQKPPLPLQHLLYCIEAVFGAGAILGVSYWLDFAYPQNNLFTIGMTILGLVFMVVFGCNGLFRITQNANTRALVLLTKLALGFSWLFASMLLFLFVVSTESNPLLPLVISGWSVIAGAIMVAGGMVLYFGSMAQDNSTTGDLDESFGWQTT